MSKPLDLHAGVNRVVTVGGFPIIVVGDAQISDATAGYLPGCLLIDKTNGVVYVNEGSVTSCDFNDVTA